MPEAERGEARIFYRCVQTNPPTEDDFLPNAAKGLVLRPPYTPERGALWAGISVYDSRERAAWRAEAMQPPVRWIAIMRVPAGAPITVEKTSQDPNHYTLWGSPRQLLRCVVSVVAAEPFSV